jgi:predicted acyl esterase
MRNAPASRQGNRKSGLKTPLGVEFTWGMKIPMRDGIKLNASLYRPEGGEKTPVIFTLTPYTMESSHGRGVFFAQCGYAFVAVD